MFKVDNGPFNETLVYTKNNDQNWRFVHRVYNVVEIA